MKNTWPDQRIQNLFGIKIPIIQAPMAGAQGAEMAIAVCRAGGLGSLPCAMLSPEEIKSEFEKIKSETKNPVNLNFFCHRSPPLNIAGALNWKKELASYYKELGIDPNENVSTFNRIPFDDKTCELVLELKPEVVSFHFGLPKSELMKKLKDAGIKIISSATTVEEAIYLEENGCDAIIAQGVEAGGHRASFLNEDIHTQVGSIVLVPQIVDAVKIPVIAAGGISEARGIAAAFALGASAVQIGTVYLFTPEAKISPVHLKALKNFKQHHTVLTNIFTGRAARGIANRMTREMGPMNDLAPVFPGAGVAMAPLRAKTEPMGSGDFIGMWSGQGAGFGREMGAEDLTLKLSEEALQRL
jgi:nitronate monooxygenase